MIAAMYNCSLPDELKKAYVSAIFKRVVQAGREITDRLVFWQLCPKYVSEIWECKSTITLMEYNYSYYPASGKGMYTLPYQKFGNDWEAKIAEQLPIKNFVINITMNYCATFIRTIVKFHPIVEQLAIF